MTVAELVASLETTDGYVTNSMLLKSFDDRGATYKYLFEYKTDLAIRKEIFIATTGTGDLDDRTVTKWVYIYPSE